MISEVQTPLANTDGPAPALALASGSVLLWNADCRDVLPHLTGINAVISDPPFSARTHSGHDAIEGDGNDGARRSSLGYEPWGDAEVAAVCAALPASGWVCILTDYVLARSWEQHMRAVGRYVFAPLPLVVRGRSVRLTGDGPSSWTDWMVVSRTKSEIKWGTLPGVYEGVRGSIEHMGGKPLNAMCRIVEDYTREGDTVLDFCMGANHRNRVPADGPEIRGHRKRPGALPDSGRAHPARTGAGRSFPRFTEQSNITICNP